MVSRFLFAHVYDWIDFSSGGLHRLYFREDGVVLFLSAVGPIVDSGWHGFWTQLQGGGKMILLRYHGEPPLVAVTMKLERTPWLGVFHTCYVRNRPCAAAVFQGYARWNRQVSSKYATGLAQTAQVGWYAPDDSAR